MSEIPEDIMEAARSAFRGGCGYPPDTPIADSALIIYIACAILAERARHGWQTIETAPKDGTRIDLWGVNHLTLDKRGERIVNVKWGAVSDWMGRERDDWQHGRGEDFEPTHWMPLPSPPKP